MKIAPGSPLANIEGPAREALEALLGYVSGAAPEGEDARLARRDTHWQDLLECAALSGRFGLSRMLSQVPTDLQDDLGAELLRVSDVDFVGERRRHILDIDQRDRVLRALRERPEALTTRLDSMRLDGDDRTGQELRRLLRGETPRLDRIRKEKRLEDLLAASVWLERTGTSPLPSQGIRHEIAERASDRAFQDMLSHGFYGRRPQMRELETFATAKDPGEQRILVLDGIGGAGKTALLARLTLNLRERGTVPVLYLDFDNPALDPEISTTLILEVSRQFASRFPEIAPRLSEIRNMIRETLRLDETSGADGSRAEVAGRSDSEASYELRMLLEQVGANTKPLLVILDTFEEVMSRGEFAVHSVRNWINFMRYEIGCEGLRVIVSGRATDELVPETDRSSDDHWEDTEVYQQLPIFEDSRFLNLPDLKEAEAVALLKRLDLDAESARKIFAAFGGNPLVLRLSARVLATNENLSIDDLISEDDGAHGSALAQGVLYSRVLRHIGLDDADPLRRVAMPGLALRRVTPKVIREVIAPVLGIEGLKDLDAKALWQRLVSQIWLVRKTGMDVAEHRRDLRKTMIALMRRDPKLDATARALHKAAADWYESGKDDTLEAPAARLEALYHRLMIHPREADLSSAERQFLQPALRGGIGDLPAHARALARFYLVGTEKPLRNDEAALLPRNLVYPWAIRTGWQRIHQGQPRAAVDLARSMRDGALKRRVPVWEISALHDAGGWEEAAERIGLAMEGLEDGSYNDGPSLDPSFGEYEHSFGVASLIGLLAIQRDEPGLLSEIPAQRAVWRALNHKVLRKLPEARAEYALRLVSYHQIASRLNGRPLDRELQDIISKLVSLPLRKSSHENTSAAYNRVVALEWAAGRLELSKRPGRMPTVQMLPDMIDPSPAAIERTSRLVRAWSDVTGRIGWDEAEKNWIAILDDSRGAPTSGVLLGRLSRIIHRQFHFKPIPIDVLEEAGFTPLDVAGGLLGELRFLAKSELEYCVRGDLIAPFAANFAQRLRDDMQKFQWVLPSDLMEERWRDTVKRDRSRAFGTLVDYAQKTGRLQTVACSAANVISEISSSENDGTEGPRGRISRLIDTIQRWHKAFEFA